MSKRFLLEIGLEELPAQYVAGSEEALKKAVESWLKDVRLPFEKVSSFSTPRRLAVAIDGLGEKQADRQEEVRGPAKRIAVDADGQWTKAAIGFARGQHVEPTDLTIKTIKDQEYVFASVFEQGLATDQLLSELKNVITHLPFPKSMRWGSSELRYLRPIRWLVALYDNSIIPFEIEGVSTGNISRGHRFLGEEVVLQSADQYEQALLQEYVIVQPEERKRRINEQLKALEEKNGWVVQKDEDLLEEVVQLVEYPTALDGAFDEEYLALPEAVLITTMREHQRYFAVRNQDGTLAHRFVTVRNGNDVKIDNVQRGNEKVLRARLQDAKFFYTEDQKLTIDAALEKVKNVVFHENLKTLFDKSKRNQALVNQLGENLPVSPNTIEAAARAAYIGKFDLVTYMVGEFPELQGKMGEEYAKALGENEATAIAINEQYAPRSSDGTLPSTEAGALLALADKVDTIVAFFSKKLIPTGSQDPFALRRQAYGIVQILHGFGWQISFATLVDHAVNVLVKGGIPCDEETVSKELVQFLSQRLKGLLLDANIPHDVVEAILNGSSGVRWTFRKADVLVAHKKENDIKLHVEAMARVQNLADKASHADVKQHLLTDAHEQALFETHSTWSSRYDEAVREGNAELAFAALTQYTATITAFFDHVMVMVEDEEIRDNRLALMAALADTFSSFANMRKLHV
ncbi:glycine--tRNA ligase subunit beta [Aureibacillus halotolerans]|uniref:Glycine--tRNA ligase beta subunit n=1 Tax=Aureibacillus halotolerans TaxID=1508390 RepID=A0A4V6PWJ5_9BACI|nr:glycine--tRNA ligase subunit beta [Aureibacillus halotolerans]TDQ41727.1 glycyl-tRNA synthetase beta chain [Aureibacillus halotolerans]